MNFKALMIFALTFVTCSVRAQWTYQSSPTDYNIESIHFVSDQVGFVGSTSGAQRTTDGGKSWNRVTAASGSDFFYNRGMIRDFYFLDSQHGFMVGTEWYGLFDMIVETKDGGATWSFVYTHNRTDAVFDGMLNSITFVDTNVGFVVGYDGRFLKTTDGGTKWNPVALDTIQDLSTVYFVDASIGFVAGDRALYKTIDQGDTWQKLSIGSYTVNDLYFYDAFHGIAATNEGQLLETQDGGLSWQTTLDHGFSLTDILFENGVGYILASNRDTNESRVLKSVDNGNTWEQQDILPLNLVNALASTSSPNTLWAGGNAGKLYKTTNGGGTTLPIASFTVPEVPFCVNQVYTFKNRSYKDYTFEWRVNGALLSTDYDFTTTLPEGLSTITLTAINGTLRATKSVQKFVERAEQPTGPLDVSFKDGICAGETTTLTVGWHEWGTYSFYLNGVRLPDRPIGIRIGADTPPLDKTTTFTVKITKSNSCEVFEKSTDVTVTVHPRPFDVATVSPVGLDICNAGAAAININHANANTRYELRTRAWREFLDSTRANNGETAVLHTPHITDTTQYFIKATITNSACEQWLPITVNVEKVTADFELSLLHALPDEPVSVYNNAFGATDFSWFFSDASDQKTSSERNPVPVLFSVPGQYEVSLRAAAPSGCSDTTTRPITIYDNAVMDASCWATSIVGSFGVAWQGTRTDVAAMPSGDVIVTGLYDAGDISFVSESGSTNKYSAKAQTNFLARYSPEGVVRWVIPKACSGFESMNVTIGADDAIFLLHETTNPAYRSVDGSVTQLPDTFDPNRYLIKYSPAGKVLWVKMIESDLAHCWYCEKNIQSDAQGNVYLTYGKDFKLSSEGKSLLTWEELQIGASDSLSHIEVAGDGSWFFFKGYNSNKLAHYTPSGVKDWEQKFSWNGIVDADYAGNLIYVARNTNIPDSDSGFFNYLLVKLSPTGSVVWSTRLDQASVSRGLYTSDDGAIHLRVQNSWYKNLPTTVYTPTGTITLGFDDPRRYHYLISTTYLLSFDAAGSLIRHRFIADPQTGTGPMAVFHTTSSGSDVYIVGEIGGDAIVNGDIIHHGDNDEMWNKNTLVLAKFGATCEDVSPNIDVSFFDDGMTNYYCPGTSWLVTYRFDERYLNYGNPNFKVYISPDSFFDFHPQELQYFGDISQSGQLEIPIPENLVYGTQYNIRIVAEQDPDLYSASILVPKYVLQHYTPDLSYSVNDSQVRLYSKDSNVGVEYRYIINQKDTLVGDPRLSGEVYFEAPTAGFEATLLMTTACGNMVTSSSYVSVNCDMRDNLKISQVVDQKTIRFTATVDGRRKNSFLWKFSDGTQSTEQNPVHTFPEYGSIHYTLILTNQCGQLSQSGTVNLICPTLAPAISFEKFNNKVVFTYSGTSSLPEQSSYFWEFGDGSVSDEKNPVHEYTSEGSYAVTLTEKNECATRIARVYILLQCPKPILSFVYSKQNKTIAFSGSFLNVNKVLWNFGDGQEEWSGGAEISHTYAAPGVYRVCVSASNDCGTVQWCKDIEVSCPLPNADFTFDIVAGNAVAFSNTSSAFTDSGWIFGDGAKSVETSPVHNFEPGTYEVCLVAENACGADQICKQVTVVLTSVELPLAEQSLIYPNPVTDHLIVKSNQGRIDYVEVFNLLGELVYQEQLMTPRTEWMIQARNWNSGVYVVVWRTGSIQYAQKIIKN